jgi:dTDP-4-amino-4,6-dideoxygalactose transaminase
MIPWPRPLYSQEGLGLPKDALLRTEQACRECLSLPIYPEMDGEQISTVVQGVMSFFE